MKFVLFLGAVSLSLGALAADLAPVGAVSDFVEGETCSPAHHRTVPVESSGNHCESAGGKGCRIAPTPNPDSDSDKPTVIAPISDLDKQAREKPEETDCQDDIRCHQIQVQQLKLLSGTLRFTAMVYSRMVDELKDATAQCLAEETPSGAPESRLESAGQI